MKTDPLHVRVEEARVVVSTPARTQTWTDLIAISREGGGRRRVLAVGAPLETMRRHVEEAAPVQVDLHHAFSVETFDFEVAAAFLMYVLYEARRDLPWWRAWRRPELHFDHPRFAEIPGRHRVALERYLLDSSRALYLNGARTQ